jgi:TatD DNase family protein
MPLIDTHAHLFDDRFAKDLPAVLERAAAAGLERVVCLGIDLETSLQSVRQIELSRRLNKPFVIHCREAEADVVKALREQSAKGPLRAVMHSFSGDLATALECLQMGLYISFAGMVTYPTAQNLRDVAAQVPLGKLLVETDCPYLAPQPVRGKRNEPAYVTHTAALLAQVKGVSVSEIEEHTTRNAKALFGL